MKTIGLIGGMSWESTATYYRLINEQVKVALGGFHSAKIMLYSVDFDEIERLQSNENWQRGAKVLTEVALSLQGAGADFILICTNTMHKVANEVQAKISVPLLHIAEAAAAELTKNKIKKVALLGTKYTMKQTFYSEKIEAAGIAVIIPDDEDIELINHVIYHELCMGNIAERSRQAFARIIGKLAAAGAQGVVLGCTEIGLLISPEDSVIPVFDTTQIHAAAAVKMALGE